LAFTAGFVFFAGALAAVAFFTVFLGAAFFALGVAVFFFAMLFVSCFVGRYNILMLKEIAIIKRRK
jgi:hypothetical protein